MKHRPTRYWGLRTIFLFSYLVSLTLNASEINQSGHLKLQSLVSDDSSTINAADLRLNFILKQSAWAWQADYQLFTQHGESVGGLTGQTNSDDFRLMDLTEVISEASEAITTHRLDRLHLTYSSEFAVFRLGRQAVSWGNGLIYNPMDFFNPFDPAAIDREYKTGDDMLYGQFSFDSGDDLQAVWVERRDETGNSSNEVSSVAIKYHLFLEDNEFDFLMAEHFDQSTVGVGGVANVGGSVWRSDFVSTEVDNQWLNSAILNISYSWLAWDKNMSGHVEFYRNGFGINDSNYSPVSLSDNSELLDRLQRGELFTLGKNYLAVSATVELTPLWLFTTTLFGNLDDYSELFQLVSQHDLQQNLQLSIAVNLPTGDEGSEFGGIDSGVPGKPLSIYESLFAQLAFYF